MTIYYVFWTIFLGLAYAYLTDEFYLVGRVFGTFTSILIIPISLISLIIFISFYYFRFEKRLLYKRLIKLIILPALGLIPFFIIKSIPNKLDGPVHTIRVQYIAYGCECANWRILDDNLNKNMEPNSEDIFLEPINRKVILPDSIIFNGISIELTGKYYSKKGFPRGYSSEQMPEKARVFQYTDYKIIGNSDSMN